MKLCKPYKLTSSKNLAYKLTLKFIETLALHHSWIVWDISRQFRDHTLTERKCNLIELA